MEGTYPAIRIAAAEHPDLARSKAASAAELGDTKGATTSTKQIIIAAITSQSDNGIQFNSSRLSAIFTSRSSRKANRTPPNPDMILAAATKSSRSSAMGSLPTCPDEGGGAMRA